ncbi:MAG: TrmH family RNA methyltransferase [Pseudomonadota bacterium]
MSFHAYLLCCADGSYYAGHTDTLEHRIAQHQHGEISGYTQTRRPVSLIWSQEFPSRLEALAAERQIKGWTRRKKEALIRGDWADLHDAAIPPSERALRLRSGRTEEDGGDLPFPARAERSRSTSATRLEAPAIVLVRPQLGENIGKAARAMLNFGLADLRLVAPRDGWPNPSAGPAASGADAVLAKARVFDTVAAAVADCAHVYATTVRKRGVTKPVVTPAEAAAAVHADSGRAAFLFGPERSGLETDDVALARTIVTVPINPEFGSLNLAQAVILIAYEWSKGQQLAQPPASDLDPPAPHAELEGAIGQLEAMLGATGYYFPPDRAPVTRRTLRTLLTKPGWSSQEVRTLRGVLSALAGKKLPRG